MRVHEKREATSPLSKFNSIIHLAVEHEKLLERADDLSRKISSESDCSDGEDASAIAATLSFRSIGAIDSTTTKSKARLASDDADDTSSSESDTIESLGYSSLYKYKNPYSLSVKDRARFESVNRFAQENVAEDEPREGRANRGILLSCREYLANYQESCGTPRSEYSYAALITVMARAIARSLWALVYVFANVVAPVIQMFSFILRFVLDKVIDIRGTGNVQRTTVKSAILAVQLLSVYVCLAFMFDLIVLPIAHMAVGIATKIAMRD